MFVVLLVVRRNFKGTQANTKIIVIVVVDFHFFNEMDRVKTDFLDNEPTVVITTIVDPLVN